MKRRGCWIGLGVVVLIVGIFLATGPGQAFLDIWRTGAVQEAMRKDEGVAYEGDSDADLQSVHTALMLFHDSEGEFPAAERWMDAILPRLRTGDLKKDEELKKLKRPEYADDPDRFGYVFNRAAGEKYKDDLDPKMPLVFESDSKLDRNASGDPKTDGSGTYVAVDGSVGKL